MKGKLKSNKGITLLALIITIIVLLILATVSIKLLVDNGIIGRAKNATNKYTVEEEKEKINLAYADYKMAKAENGTATLTVNDATVSGDETSGWTITFAKTGNRYKFVPSQGTPELKPKTEEENLLEKYFLGKNENGDNKNITDVIPNLTDEGVTPLEWKFIDNDIVEGSTKLKTININEDEENMYLYLKYENKVYRLQVSVETMENMAVELVYEPTGREGQKVKYSYDGTVENEKDWTILYDYGDSVEIISSDVMGNLTLGCEDEEAQTPGDVDKDGEENTREDKGIYSYNNAVNRLNKYCSNLVTNNNKISVRSVGSNPNNPSAESGMYKSERLSQWVDGKYNGLGKNGDLNAEKDFIRMSYYGVAFVGSDYWLASRNVNDYPTNPGINFNLIYFGDNYGLQYVGLLYVDNAGILDRMNGGSFAVRPVVKISSDSIK